MKKIQSTFLLSILLATTFQLQGQNSDWSAPEPFVVSSSDKANAFLGNIGSNAYLLAWEQSTDSASTAIYYKNYLTGEYPVLLLSDSMTHYKNPKICRFLGNSDTTFMILYEKVFDGKSEIHYMKFSQDGGHSGPLPIATEGTANNILEVNTTEFSFNRQIAWNSNNHLLVSHTLYENNQFTFAEPDTLFIGEITDIKNKYQQIYWIARNGQSDRLMISTSDYQGNNWSEPEEIIIEDKISSLGGAIHEMDDFSVSFSYKSEDNWHINNYYQNLSGSYSWFYPLDLSSEEAFDFDTFATYYGVDNDLFDLQIYHLAFVDDTLGSREIFMTDQSNYNLFQLTFFGTECRNPAFFLGEYMEGGNWGYLIWETYLDGFWQLHYSRAPFSWGSIEEKNNLEKITVSPNPATNFIQIENINELDLSIRLFNITGKLVFSSQKNSAIISINTQKLVRGIYLLNILNGEEKLTRKIILE